MTSRKDLHKGKRAGRVRVRTHPLKIGKQLREERMWVSEQRFRIFVDCHFTTCITFRISTDQHLVYRT